MSATAPPPTPPQTFRFIGCHVLYREALYLAATSRNRVLVEFLEKGLHDLQTQAMVDHIQGVVDAASQDAYAYDAILLGYARCNDGLVGVTARDVPLVIPKAHDCITLFFGSRGAYQTYFDEHPGTYYETSGWMEHADTQGEDGHYNSRPAYGQEGVMASLGLTDSYEELVEKHGQENADYIIETLGGWEKAYSRLLYLTMGITDESACIAQGQQRCEQNHWQFEQREGSLTLLEKLFEGDWDDDFVIVQPGQTIVARNNEEVLAAE